ncbi:hypothetical protein COCNU_06G007940 [Cocos nucifera]|uniref:Uncharacterized protein n=1 Tax=Cocos nucifera TaxID=13894 RepID=A0A8K0IBJ7_COCNU|nr:hypothetical protein COCNU_06G007940 [Cocos nucifera]
MAERASGRSPSPEEVLLLGVQGARPPGSSADGGSSFQSLGAGEFGRYAVRSAEGVRPGAWTLGSSAARQFGRLKEFG